MLELLAQYQKAEKREAVRNDFMTFVRAVWPNFIAGRHHKIMAEKFKLVASGQLKRLIINMPPRHTKSEFASYLLPSWYLGLYPDRKIIQASHTSELSVGFGRKARNLVDSATYKELFPETALRADSKAAGRWNTSKGGDYFAIGVGGAVTGKGADLLIIDDAHSEQDAVSGAHNAAVFNTTWDWFLSGPRQRLQPGGAIVIVMCMVGDTNVLMANGMQKKLRDIQSGDLVATYENGVMSSAPVTNFRSNGVDNVYRVKTQSGRTVCANERHPFLVDDAGERKWIRLKDLRVGMSLVGTKDAHVRNTCGFEADQIVEITPAGREEVFDVEVGRTENFIANGLVSHNTRWSKIDLTGRILQHSMEKDGEEWEVISFPAILPSGLPLWPEYWSLRELESLRKDLPIARWQAQYQQAPTSEEGAIIKREWWQTWDNTRLPHFESIIISWDTAFEKSERSDYSACTVWGVFSGMEKPVPGALTDKTSVAKVMLIDAVRGKYEFPELKAEALKMWKRWKPDMMIVESKAAGAPLIFELRAMGIPVQEFKPTRGNDKIARANACSDMFSSKMVYALNTRWAEDVIEETAEFPYGEHDDYVDTVTQALLRIRQGGYIRTDLDEKDEDERPPVVHEYY